MFGTSVSHANFDATDIEQGLEVVLGHLDVELLDQDSDLVKSQAPVAVLVGVLKLLLKEPAWR